MEAYIADPFYKRQQINPKLEPTFKNTGHCNCSCMRENISVTMRERERERKRVVVTGDMIAWVEK